MYCKRLVILGEYISNGCGIYKLVVGFLRCTLGNWVSKITKKSGYYSFGACNSFVNLPPPPKKRNSPMLTKSCHHRAVDWFCA